MARRKRSPKFSDAQATGSAGSPGPSSSPNEAPDRPAQTDDARSSHDPTASLTSPIGAPIPPPSTAPAQPPAPSTAPAEPPPPSTAPVPAPAQPPGPGPVSPPTPSAGTAAVAGNGSGNGNGQSNGNGQADGESATVTDEPRPTEPSSTDEPRAADETPPAGELSPEPGEAAADGEAAPGPDDDAGPAHSPGNARRARQRAIRTALATLPVPPPEPGFWAGLNVALAEQKPLAISARPAIRPISEPPPLSQPRPGDQAPSDPSLRMGSRSSQREAKDLLTDRSSRRKLLAVIVGFVVALLVVGSTLAEDGDDPVRETTTTTALDGEVTTTQPGATATTIGQIRGLEADTAMTPAGVGPLQIGSRLADLDGQSVERIVDESTFQGSDGTCFDVHLPAMLDLTLRYRSPDPARGVGDPREGVLASVTISTQTGSQRGSEAAMGLLAPEEAVREAHRGSIDVVDDPYLPGGEIYLVPATDGSGNGLAYTTDGEVVTAIAVGTLDTISSPQPCI
jgi:hypothetical protein